MRRVFRPSVPYATVSSRPARFGVATLWQLRGHSDSSANRHDWVPTQKGWSKHVGKFPRSQVLDFTLAAFHASSNTPCDASRHDTALSSLLTSVGVSQEIAEWAVAEVRRGLDSDGDTWREKCASAGNEQREQYPRKPESEPDRLTPDEPETPTRNETEAMEERSGEEEARGPDMASSDPTVVAERLGRLLAARSPHITVGKSSGELRTITWFPTGPEENHRVTWNIYPNHVVATTHTDLKVIRLPATWAELQAAVTDIWHSWVLKTICFQHPEPLQERITYVPPNAGGPIVQWLPGHEPKAQIQAKRGVFIITGESGSGKTRACINYLPFLPEVGATWTDPTTGDVGPSLLFVTMESKPRKLSSLSECEACDAKLRKKESDFGKMLRTQGSLGWKVRALLSWHLATLDEYLKRNLAAEAAFFTELSSATNYEAIQGYTKLYTEPVLIVLDEVGRYPAFARGVVAHAQSIYKQLEATHNLANVFIALCGTGLDMYAVNPSPSQPWGSNPDDVWAGVVRQPNGDKFAEALWNKSRVVSAVSPQDLPHQPVLRALWQNARLASYFVDAARSCLSAPAPSSALGVVVKFAISSALYRFETANGLAALRGRPAERRALLAVAVWTLQRTAGWAASRHHLKAQDRLGLLELSPRVGGNKVDRKDALLSAGLQNLSVRLRRTGSSLGPVPRDWDSQAMHPEDSGVWAFEEKAASSPPCIDFHSGGYLDATRFAQKQERAVQLGLLEEASTGVYTASEALTVALMANFDGDAVVIGDGPGFERLVVGHVKRLVELQGYDTIVVELKRPYLPQPGSFDGPLGMEARDVQTIVTHLNDKRYRRTAVVLLNGPGAAAFDVGVIAKDSKARAIHLDLWDLKHQLEGNATEHRKREQRLGIVAISAPRTLCEEDASWLAKFNWVQAALVCLATAATVADVPAELSAKHVGRYKSIQANPRANEGGTMGPTAVWYKSKHGMLWRLSRRAVLMDSLLPTSAEGERKEVVSWCATEWRMPWDSLGKERVCSLVRLEIQHRQRLGLLYHSVEEPEDPLPTMLDPRMNRQHHCSLCGGKHATAKCQFLAARLDPSPLKGDPPSLARERQECEQIVLGHAALLQRGPKKVHKKTTKRAQFKNKPF